MDFGLFGLDTTGSSISFTFDLDFGLGFICNNSAGSTLGSANTTRFLLGEFTKTGTFFLRATGTLPLFNGKTILSCRNLSSPISGIGTLASVKITGFLNRTIPAFIHLSSIFLGNELTGIEDSPSFVVKIPILSPKNTIIDTD